jgi:hypothetical protein
MTHSLCALLHYLADTAWIDSVGTSRGYRFIENPYLCSAVPEGVKHGYVETRGTGLDSLWVTLTPKGLELALESLNAMEAAS